MPDCRWPHVVTDLVGDQLPHAELEHDQQPEQDECVDPDEYEEAPNHPYYETSDRARKPGPSRRRARLAESGQRARSARPPALARPARLERAASRSATWRSIQLSYGRSKAGGHGSATARENMAERVGFEPTVPLGTHAFQACALSRSAISPFLSVAERFGPATRLRRVAETMAEREGFEPSTGYKPLHP